MKSGPKIIAYLNGVLKNELTSINQYFLHARMFKNWGFHKLGEYEEKQSVDEMKHADRLIRRILFLEGVPNLQDLGKLTIGENVPEALTSDLSLEQSARTQLQEAIKHCESAADFVSRELFRSILDSEEDHIDWLETQLDLIDTIGLQNYLQTQTASADVSSTS